MTNRKFFKIVLSLIVAGIVLSLLSLSLPVFIASDAKLSAAGQIASAIAAIFGMATASLAIWAYLDTESVEQKLANETFQVKTRLGESLNQAAEMFVLSAEQNDGKIEGLYAHHALIVLRDALEEVRNAPLFSVLGHEAFDEKTMGKSAACFVILLEAQVREALEKSDYSVPSAFVYSAKLLWKSLENLTPEIIRSLLSKTNRPSDAIELLKKLGDSLKEQRDRAK